MKKHEKTELTRERILSAAIKEFGTSGYEGTALNAICSGHGIAKGLIYHNFKNKDMLYLACVGQCLSAVTEFLREKAEGTDLHGYMELRFRFFTENPLYARIFFEAVLQPPRALQAEIHERKAEFTSLNREIYRSLLSRLTLRKGVTEQDALDYYELVQEMWGGHFCNCAHASANFGALVADYEQKLCKALDFMLYGIVKGGEEL